jgi:hypothetical protein
MNSASAATLRFNGTSVSLIMFQDQWAGIASVFVDDVLKGEVDTYSSPSKAQANVYTVSGLTNGAHTVTLRPTGRKNPSSGGLWIWLDAFDVAATSSTTTTGNTGGTPSGSTTSGGTTSGGSTASNSSYRVEQSSPAVRWSGAWSLNNNAMNSGASARLSMTAGARATFTFTGTSVKWIGYRDQWSGIGKVYVDGSLRASVDMYASPAAARAVAYTLSGLPLGTHTVVVEVSATKNPSSRGYWVWVDAVDYTGAALTASSESIGNINPLAATNLVTGQHVISSGGTPLQVGWGSAEMQPGGQPPSGLAVIGYRQNGALVTEAGIPASVPVLRGRFFAEATDNVRTGLALANPNESEATVSFSFTNQIGNDFPAGTLTIPPRGQLARFLDQAPFHVTSPATGAFTFSSNVPVAAIALRTLVNERWEPLLTTLPVADPDVPNPATIFFPLVAGGGGWSTQFALVNPADNVITGTIRYLEEVTTYAIPARSVYTFGTAEALPQVRVGSAEVTPDSGMVAPSGVAIFSFKNAGVTVSQAGVPSMSMSSAFRMYAERVGGVRTGLALQNVGETAAVVNFELTRLNGTEAPITGTLQIPKFGQRTLFVNEIPGFESLPQPFEGILRILPSNEGAVSVLGLRGRTNERGDFLITTIPAMDENESSPAKIVFPHIVNGDGYTTEFVTFGGGPARLFSQPGAPWSLNFR